MKKIYYDLIYLIACELHHKSPSPKCLQSYQGESAEKLKSLYQFSQLHFLDAFVGTVLKKSGVALPKEWNESIAKAIRKEVLFDVERGKILNYMEKQGIWYLPLKGIVLKKYYPSLGLRQMSDNDILIDEHYAKKLEQYMISKGYEATLVGHSNHDVYKKPPVYNFELHRSLYGTRHKKEWKDYYKNIKEKLLKDENNSYGYHMSDEDFYIYIVCHAYKHYLGSGTGIRSLLDFYVYLSQKEEDLDFTYIEKTCKLLEISDFEKQSRLLCKKVFSKEVTRVYNPHHLLEELSNEEKKMLWYYLTSGTYGTYERAVKNRLAEYKKFNIYGAKMIYCFRRIFPRMEFYEETYPFAYKHKWAIPIAWVLRVIGVLRDDKRRKNIGREMKIVRKVH